MHYIDLDLVDLDLPDDWDETVRKANEYVSAKIEAATTTSTAKTISDGMNINEARVYIQKEKDKARKKAIGDKNIWSNLSDLLSKLSNGKCWYCETKEDRSDNPIDHFRPKNKVAECDGHPGYYWLAFDWRNYRYACTYCNSRRIDINTDGGKHDHFPLLPPEIWNMCDTDSNVEKPKLLDPCDIEDNSLLTFNIHGKACAINDDESSEEYIRADTSIKLYHLNKKSTCRERKVIYQTVNRLVSTINTLIDQDIDGNKEQIKSNKKQLMNMIRYACPDTKFNSTAKTYLRIYRDQGWVMDILEKI